MTEYYKQTGPDGELLYLLTYDFPAHITDPLTVPLTAEEYARALEELAGEPVPEPEPSDEISSGEFMEMLEAVL